MTDTERSLMAASVVITHNLFDEIYNHHKIEGFMHTVDKIIVLSFEFETKFKDVLWGKLRNI